MRVGDIVQPGQPLADIADVDALDVRLEVPVAQVAQVKLGDSVPVTVNNANIWATVSQIFPAANADQHTVTVKLALPQGAAAAPGMYARAWIAQAGGVGPSTLTPAIPTNAIAYRGSLPVAFVITRARRRDARAETRRHDGRPHRRAGRPERGRKGDRQSLARSQVGRVPLRPDAVRT